MPSNRFYITKILIDTKITIIPQKTKQPLSYVYHLIMPLFSIEHEIKGLPVNFNL